MKIKNTTIIFLAIMLILFVIMQVNAASLKAMFTTSKDNVADKQVTKETNSNIQQQKSALTKQESAAKAPISKVSSEKLVQQKTTQSPKLTVVSEKSVQVNSDAPKSVCFNPTSNVISIDDTISPTQFEYKNVGASCSRTGNILDQDNGIVVVICSQNAMTVRCSTGTTINYGGFCNYPTPISFLGPITYTTFDWSDKSPVETVQISCANDADKTIRVTCMREKG